MQGRILYIDRESDRSHAAAGLRVEIWDKDERGFTTGEKLGETVTDDGGFFVSGLIPNVDPDGPAGQMDGTQDVFLKLFTNNGDVRLLEAGTQQEFGWASYEIDPRDGLRRNVPDGIVPMPPLYVMENTRDVEALWSFVNLVQGWRYLASQTETNPGPVTAYWSAISQDGPRYDPVTRGIHLRDADAGFADVVLQQEAYALVHNALGTWPDAWKSCGPGPSNFAIASDPACAFIGGFATYFPLAVTGDPEFAALTLGGENLDEATAGTPGWADGDTVPGRIAGALWDLGDADKTEEFYDTYNDSFVDIWHVLATRAPATFHDWWQGWLAEGMNGCEALGSLFQNTIDYNTAPQLAAPPEIRLQEDTVATVNFADLASDAECDDASLMYLLPDAGAPEAGVTMGITGVLTVQPEANWFGDTQIRVAVSDGPATAEASIHVVVESVNDNPVIRPRVSDQEVLHGNPITLQLAPYGVDVEDPSYMLTWDIELEPDDAPVVHVTGRGTPTLVLTLDPIVLEERMVRAVLVVRDTEGGEGRQPIVLRWTARPNTPPFIRWDRFAKEYEAAMNHNILVDLTNVAGDATDDPSLLAWYAREVDHAQVGGEGTQTLEFDPDVDFIGYDVVELEVRDLQGASASGTITLTWDDPAIVNNQPPRINRNLLRGKTVGTNGTACYALTDMATDPDDPPLSLRWFITDYEGSDVRVTGQGTQRLCLISRPQFKGCHETNFVVMDPKGAEDSEPIRTCWKTIALYFPRMETKPR